jgi:hypothetical protein
VANYNDIRAAIGAAIESYQPGLNVYDYVPRSLTPPSAIVQPVPHRTIDYTQVQGRGAFAKWRFTIHIVIGQVDEQSAQQQAGDLISPGSPMIRALNRLPLTNGQTVVETGGIAQMMFDQGLYTAAELAVCIVA